MPEQWPDLDKNNLSPGLFLKRYEVINDADHDRTLIFAVYVHAETNGGIGEPVLSWLDDDQALLASNAGHGHSNRKLARDATVSFVLALDGSGETNCEPVGPIETMLTRNLFVPARG
ncbi:MAG: glycosyl hydrolase, partial [bacterium]